jgi:hypothetical protein
VKPIELFNSLLSDLVKPSPSISLVLGFFLVNLTLSCLLSWVLVYSVQLDVVKRKKAFNCFIFSIAAFIPVLGNLINILVLLVLKRYGKDFEPIEIDRYPQVEYSRKNPVKIVAYGFNWASVRLESTQFSEEERTKALNSVSRGSPRETNLVYSKLVSDELEELRICAFSLLESQQDFLQTQINQLLKKFDGMEDALKKAYLAKQIALLYWELVYRNLADQEFRSILLERSIYYAEYALKTLAEDATLLVLRARIDIAQNKDKEGYQSLLAAAQYHASKSKILPYFAELAFQKKDYAAVRDYLSSERSLKYIFKMSKIIDFWCPK